MEQPRRYDDLYPMQPRGFERYPCVRGVQGIAFGEILPEDLKVMEPGWLVPINGESGSPLLLSYRRRGLSIRAEEGSFKMVAEMHTDSPTVEFDLKTWSSSAATDRHPDLFPGRFITSALNFLRANGNEITAACGSWPHWSLNYAEYIRGRELGLYPKDAARTTWNGLQLRRNGFKVLRERDIKESTYEGRPLIRATFRTR